MFIEGNYWILLFCINFIIAAEFLHLNMAMVATSINQELACHSAASGWCLKLQLAVAIAFLSLNVAVLLVMVAIPGPTCVSRIGSTGLVYFPTFS